MRMDKDEGGGLCLSLNNLFRETLRGNTLEHSILSPSINPPDATRVGDQGMGEELGAMDQGSWSIRR